MARFKFKLTGISPLLMHADNIDWADAMTVWKDSAKNKKDSKAGDDRSPAWRWTGYTYLSDTALVMPCDNVASALMKAGSRVPIPGGKFSKTFKEDTMAGMAIVEEHCQFLVSGKEIAREQIEAFQLENDFAKHRTMAEALGFALHVKRAQVGTSKHVRVRPRFDKWSVIGTLDVWDEKLAKSLPEILAVAGAQVGLGDWRPSSKKPGPYGRFTHTLEVANG